MLKRIAVAADDAKLVKTLKMQAEQHDVLVHALSEGEALPPATSGIVASLDKPAAILSWADNLGEEQYGVLTLLADAIACRESLPLGADERVRQHAVRFGEALGLSREDLLVLERGAILRDIGKIKVPNDVLLKKSVLDYDEWMLLQGHAKLGADLLRERGIATDVIEVVECHHECWDGDGYPQHLEKEQIPYLARIMKIIDVFCAMTSPRLYRKTVCSHEDALHHFRSEQGKHYDPELVDVFINAEVGRPYEASA